jgi:hypothetical protein
MTISHIFLAENGHHSKLSDDKEPSADLIRGQEKLAKTSGVRGYVARVQGIPGQVKLMMLQPINDPKVPFDVSAQKYYDRVNTGGRRTNNSNRSIFSN